MKYGQKEILINAASGSPEPAWKHFIAAAALLWNSNKILPHKSNIKNNYPKLGSVRLEALRWGGSAFSRVFEGKPSA